MLRKKIFLYNHFRNIEAHNFPSVRESDGIAYIWNSKTNSEEIMDLTEVDKITISYCYFIEALGLPKPRY